MTAEILSIIAVCISGLATIVAASVPSILGYISKKAELKAQKQKQYDEQFESFYNKHLKIYNDFSTLFGKWKLNPESSSELIEFIYVIAPQFLTPISHWLYVLADKIKNFKTGENLDTDYKRCVNLILDSYGARISGNTPDILIPDILRFSLKKQFDHLQNAPTEYFHFHEY